MSAELEDTGYKIPLVSEKKVSAFAEYEAFHNFIVSLNCSYYSEKKQGGDIKNQLENIPSYYTADIGLKYKKEFLSFYLKANNIFNENYITSAYENSGYPMPGRNFTAGVKAEF
jgi:outer membrane receptor protein involved in Fe transport